MVKVVYNNIDNYLVDKIERFLDNHNTNVIVINTVVQTQVADDYWFGI